MALPQVKIPFLVLMSEIKIDLTLKKANFLFLLWFKIAISQFNAVRQPSGDRHNFFTSHQGAMVRENIWKMTFFPCQGKVREFCGWSGKFRKALESQ